MIEILPPTPKKTYLWGESAFCSNKEVNNMDDLDIIELYFARDEQAETLQEVIVKRTLHVK